MLLIDGSNSDHRTIHAGDKVFASWHGWVLSRNVVGKPTTAGPAPGPVQHTPSLKVSRLPVQSVSGYDFVLIVYWY